MMSPATASSLMHALVGHERHRVAELHLAAEAQVAHLHRRRVAARAHAEERDAVAVLRVHVRLDLEHEAGERRLGRLHDARAAVARLRRRRPVDQRLQDLLHAEVVDAGAEEHAASAGRRETRARSNGGLALRSSSTSWRSARDLVRDRAASSRGLARPSMRSTSSLTPLLARREAHQPVVQQVEHAAKRLAHADRPGHRRAVDLQHRLDLLEQRRAARAPRGPSC